MLGEGLKGLGRDGLEAVCQGAGLLRGHNPGNTGWNRMNKLALKIVTVVDRALLTFRPHYFQMPYHFPRRATP